MLEGAANPTREGVIDVQGCESIRISRLAAWSHGEATRRCHVQLQKNIPFRWQCCCCRGAVRRCTSAMRRIRNCQQKLSIPTPLCRVFHFCLLCRVGRMNARVWWIFYNNGLLCTRCSARCCALPRSVRSTSVRFTWASLTLKHNSPFGFCKGERFGLMMFGKIAKAHVFPVGSSCFCIDCGMRPAL